MSEELTVEQVCELIALHSHDYPSPTDPYVWLTEYDWRAITDELNAMTGRDKCKYVGRDVFECSKCGCHLDLEDAASCEPTMWVDGEAACPLFCPNCGRRVAYGQGNG